MKKNNINLTKGKITKLYKINKQTRKRKRIPKRMPNKNRNTNTFRKRWMDLSNKTLKKMSGGNNENTKFFFESQPEPKQVSEDLKLEMPETEIQTQYNQNVSEEMINELPEEILETIVSGSIFEPEIDDINDVNEVNDVQEKQENPFESINNVAHVLASSSDLPLPVYGGQKQKNRFRLTKSK